MSYKMMVEFGPDQSDVLAAVADRLNVSRASVLRYGLSLISIAVNEARKGNAMAVVNDDGLVLKQIAGAWPVAPTSK